MEQNATVKNPLMRTIETRTNCHLQDIGQRRLMTFEPACQSMTIRIIDILFELPGISNAKEA